MNPVPETDDLERRLAAVPEVRAFAAKPACPKCGHRDRLTGMQLWSGGCTGFDWHFCAGSCDERSQVQVIPGVIQTEVRNHCFGIFAEHLHLRCRRCGFHFLMQTREAAAR